MHFESAAFDIAAHHIDAAIFGIAITHAKLVEHWDALILFLIEALLHQENLLPTVEPAAAAQAAEPPGQGVAYLFGDALILVAVGEPRKKEERDGTAAALAGQCGG